LKAITNPEAQTTPSVVVENATTMEIIDPMVIAEAYEILEHGNPIEFIMKVFNRDYIGGTEYGRLLILSALCSSCTNTSGLHPSAAGGSGEGKSWAMQVMANLLPQNRIIQGSVSPKALYYHGKELGSRFIVFLDDVGTMNEDLAGAIKRASSAFRTGCEHLTVGNGEPRKYWLPAGIAWWITGVDADKFDEQILNRAVQVAVEQTDEVKRQQYKEAIMRHQLNDVASGRCALEVDQDVKVCRELFKHLLDTQVTVCAPWVKDDNSNYLLEWHGKDNSRNLPIFCDMILTSASIHRYQRKCNKNGEVIATLEDYDNAEFIFQKFAPEVLTKLTKRDRQIIQALFDLQASQENLVDLYTLEEKLGIKYGTLYSNIYGKHKDGVKGLLDRYKWVSIDKVTETSYDVVVDDSKGYERQSKNGARGRSRNYIYLLNGAQSPNALTNPSSIVTLDRERAEHKLKKYLEEESQ